MSTSTLSGDTAVSMCYFVILDGSESSDVFVISTDIKRHVGPSAIAELLVQNIQNMADLPLLWVTAS